MCDEFFEYLDILFKTRELVHTCHLNSGDVLFLNDMLSIHAEPAFRRIRIVSEFYTSMWHFRRIRLGLMTKRV